MPRKAKPAAPKKKGAAKKREDINVLIVDDEKNLTLAMRRLLSAEGYRAEVAASGELALEAIKELSFDVVLLDVNMPGMNGLETFKKLKKQSPKSNVVMITGYGKTLKALVEEARELGVHSVIDKPFKINQITEAIQAIIPHAD
jgi:two-component system nitrogen regulation response regulator GlnG